MEANESCLILIDLQKGFRDPKWGERNNFLLEKNVAALLKAFRESSMPVIHVRHDSTEAASPLRTGSEGFAFIEEARPQSGEEIFTKRMHGAFQGTGLERFLRWKGIKAPIFAGLTTDHCVSTSVRAAHDLGFLPKVISDAVATFGRDTPFGNKAGAELVHELALASLDKEFGDVVTVAQLEYELRIRRGKSGDQLRLTKERRDTVALKNWS